MSERRPAQVFPPGDFVREEMEERGWTQQDLAEILGKPLATVNKILQGKKAVIAETARRLGAAFGTSAELWMNLESAYQLHAKGDFQDVEDVRTRAELYEKAPVREMEKRGWIDRKTSHDGRDKELRRFFGVKSLDELPQVSAAARASVRGEGADLTPAQWAWCVRALQVAKSVDVRTFQRSKMPLLVEELHRLTCEPEEIRRVPGLLASAGIRLVVVEHLSKTAMDGAALELGTTPVIALSLRYGRLDHFWFTLFHELAHVYYRDGISADAGLFESAASSSADAIEDRANSQAASWLIDHDRLSSFIMRTTPLYNAARVTNFARRMHVHPSIVAGQLKHRGELKWKQLARLNVDIRDIVRTTATTDGWGAVATV